jgi:putative metal-binding protein
MRDLRGGNSMRTALLAAMLTILGCSDKGVHHGDGVGGVGGDPDGGPNTGPSGGGGGGGGSSSGGGVVCTQTNQNLDYDGDGYTPAQGDCNDCDPGINPMAIEIPGNNQDDDCNGHVDEALPACDGSNNGLKDAMSLAQSIELCDPRFLKKIEIVTQPAGATAKHPTSDDQARNVLPTFGKLAPQAGANFALLSTGIAAAKTDPGYVAPQPGTDFNTSEEADNPLPSLMGASNCGQADNVPRVYDYTEVLVTLKAPSNVQSFSFQFQFFSAEYPEWVCSQFNDEFLVVVQSSKTYQTPINISFDANKNPITVNSGFFTICENGGTANTKNCTHPVSDIAGTGYEDKLFGIGQAVGGGTGWLTTTAPILPGEDVTLRFVIFDEGDSSLDSAALLDNFAWGPAKVSGPVTGPISIRTRPHRRAPATPPAADALMCHA